MKVSKGRPLSRSLESRASAMRSTSIETRVTRMYIRVYTAKRTRRKRAKSQGTRRRRRCAKTPYNQGCRCARTPRRATCRKALRMSQFNSVRSGEAKRNVKAEKVQTAWTLRSCRQRGDEEVPTAQRARRGAARDEAKVSLRPLPCARYQTELGNLFLLPKGLRTCTSFHSGLEL